MTKQIKIMSSEEDGSTRLAPASTIKMRCGDCIYMDGGRINPIYGQPCPERGILPKAYAPSCFIPDVLPVTKLGCDALETLGLIVGMCTPKQSRIIMALLRAQSKLAEKHLHLMQKVYFSTGIPNDNYLTEWYCGYVLSIRNDDIVLAASPSLADIKNCFQANVGYKSLVSEEDFAVIRADLISHGRIVSPRRPELSIVEVDDYEIPTIEMTPEFVEALAASREANAKARTAKRGIQKAGAQKSNRSTSLQDLLRSSTNDE
jgi:hypothetical protein